MRKAMKMTLAAVALIMALAVAFVPVSQSDAADGFEITQIQYDPSEMGVLVTLNQDITTAMFGVKLSSETETIVDASYDSSVVEDKEFVIGLDGVLADGTYTVSVTVTSTMKDSKQFIVGAPAYSINILDSEHGTVTASASKAAEGSTVHLSCMPELTYKLDSYMVYTEMGLEVPVASDNTFVMPGSNVNVKGFFVPLEPAADYTVTYVDQDGYTILPSETYKAGETVVFKVPEMGSYLVAYVEATPYVEDFDYDAETMTGTFTMPASDVKVTAYYASEESHLNFVISDGMVVYYDGNSYTSNVSFEVPFASTVSFSIGYEGTKKIQPKEVELYIGSEKQAVESFDTVYPVLVAGNVTVSVSLIDYKDTEVTGEYSSKNIFDYTQIVTVKDYWTLMNGAYVEIYGKLVVPAGTTLTIDSDAVLIIYGEAQIDGTVIVNESIVLDDGITGLIKFGGEDKYGDVYSGDTVVNGTLDIEGTVIVYGDLTMASGSSAIVQQDGKLATKAGSAMTVGSGAVVTIYGVLESQEILDEGIITFDSDVPCNEGTIYSIITLKGAGVVDVKKMTINGNYSLGVDLLAVKIGDDLAAALILQATAVTPAGEDKDAHVEASFSGVRLAIAAIDKVQRIQASGTMEVDYAYVSESSEEAPEGITANGMLALYGKAVVNDTLIAGERTKVYNLADLLVTGTIDAKNGTMQNGAVINVVDAGMIVTSARIDSEDGINATRYAEGGYYYYVDIDAAIAGANDKSVLNVLGTQTVKQDATLPAGARIELGAAYQLVIGNDKDDTLTIAEGATINGIPAIADNKIDVKGTLFIENQLNVATAVKNAITADVEIFETDAEGKLVRDGWVKYTNVYTALEEAQAGDTVNLKRDIVVDGADLVIPEGVTLDTKGNNVTVKAPWKIIDNGTFDVDSKSVVTVNGKTAALDSAEVIVNGVARSDAEFAFVTDSGDAYLTSGAYYSITDKKKTTWYIEPVANAVDDVLTYDPVPTVDGEEVPGFYVRANNGIEIGDIIIAGDSTTSAAMVVQTPMKSGVISLDSAAVVIEPALRFVGTVTDGVGTLAVEANVDLFRAVMANEQTSDSERFVAAGCYDGKLTVNGVVEIMDMVATTLDVQGEAIISDDDLAGAAFQNVTVAAGAKLAVSAGASAYVADLLNVLGDVEVAGKTATAASGYLWAEIILVGVDKNGRSTIAATPVISGNIGIGDYGLFNPNVVIPASITGSADLKPTVFYGEKEAKVCTAYASATTSGVNKNIKITVENAWLAGWALKDGTIVDDAAYGTYPAVYAKIDYYIYHLTIVADYGVQNVAIDGIILPHESIANNTYFKDLKAGVHTITVTLSTGYQGTAKVYLVQDGTPVEQAGGKVTTTGTPATAAGIFYHIQVAGAEANSGDITIHVDPSDPTVVIEKESNEWSVSTILMLVLVILIGLMAVILFLRLNRS